MPGFLEASGYEGTDKIDLGNGYWAEVKRCLSAEEKAFADALLGGKTRVKVGGGSEQFAEMDYSAMRSEMLVNSLVAWSIDDPDGGVWPLLPEKPPVPGKPYPPNSARRLSVARLPSPVFDQIYERVDELNAPRKGADAVAFREQPVSGDPDGGDGAGSPAADALGAGDVAAVRADEGDGGAAAAS